MAFATTVKSLESTDGSIIYADAVGNPANPSIVFVHGFALSGAVFDGLFTNPRLLEKFYLVRYDMRGHGRSGKPSTPDGHSSSLYADDFSTVAKAFSLVKPVFVGWSLASPIICDICTNISPVPIAGAVALSGAPTMIGPVVAKTGTPTLFDVFARFCATEDATRALVVRNDFFNACFTDPTNIPFDMKCAWIGMTVMQPPDISALVISRQQDTTKLYELGAQGFPLQVLHGKSDKVVDGAAVVEELKPHFKDLEVSLIEGSHTIFHDQQEEMLDKLIAFVDRVNAASSRP